MSFFKDAELKIVLRGGNLIHEISISDPCGKVYAQCEKHKNYWQRIYANEFASVELIRETAQRIIDACPMCEAEKPPARLCFPEGAEL